MNVEKFTNPLSQEFRRDLRVISVQGIKLQEYLNNEEF